MARQSPLPRFSQHTEETTHILPILESQLDVVIVLVLILVKISRVLALLVATSSPSALLPQQASDYARHLKRIMCLSSSDRRASAMPGRAGIVLLVVVPFGALSGLGPRRERVLVSPEGRSDGRLEVGRLGSV